METDSHIKELGSEPDEEQKHDQDRDLLADSTPRSHLRLIKSEAFDLCSSYNFKAASPRGELVRAISMSDTEEGARPTTSPISASVIPILRRSEMRDAHVLMRPSLRVPVELSQRRSVTAFRDNLGMPRPTDMPKNLNTIGQRVVWWRKHRGYERMGLAKECGMSYSTLSDLELGNTNKGTFLHALAVALGLRPQYLETGVGEPESGVPHKPPPDAGTAWLLSSLPKEKLEELDPGERVYLEIALLEALSRIAELRKGRKTG